MKIIAFLCSLSFVISAHAQQAYTDSINRYLADYVKDHEVVTGEAKQNFHFFPVNALYRVVARFEPVRDGKWFTMETSGTIKKTFRVYGYLHFTIRDTVLKLSVYQSQNLMAMDQYKNLLFLPFTDATAGEETYAAGRYIDLESTDIHNDSLVLDFNKAYNPYCAYVSGKYNCPVPPKENQLAVSILAGEKSFGNKQ